MGRKSVKEHPRNLTVIAVRVVALVGYDGRYKQIPLLTPTLRPTQRSKKVLL